MMPFGREYAQQGDFVVPVYGESMSPTYPSGSLVLARNYERWREYIDYGSTYIVELDDGTRLIKIVTKSESEGRITLHSINSTYTDNDVPITIIRRMYRVILTIRQEAM
jgi:phage repressor protein C with HTH and peptisase S24 domain